MHPTQPVDHGDPVSAPTASWIMGRSARWQTPQGRALLAQDPLLDDIRDLRTWAVGLAVIPTLPVVLGALVRALCALGSTWRRREPRER